ncbi:hypothetical protein FHG87_017061 [Trinorchestia longiramus]|nr:hypothetical protein FHG87_017061 [Trinorchestia longiramus]
MDRHYGDPSELLKITEIGPSTVKCRLSPSQSISVGVIGPFSEDTSNEYLTEALKEAGFNGAVAERIYMGYEKIKTSYATNAHDLGTVLHSANLLLPHTSNECNTNTGGNCCNCGGNHTVNYGGCPQIEQAKEGEKHAKYKIYLTEMQ